VRSSALSAVTYTSVYTDSEPGRVFWGADEELSDGGSPRVIVYGYDGLPMLPVAPPSPDYIPVPEEPQTPPAPHDEDEHEPMFIQQHDPDFSPGYVAESDLEEYPEEYEDDETEDGPVDFLMDEGDDDDDDSSRDDVDDEDEDEEDEEEEHLAPTNFAVVIPIDELTEMSPRKRLCFSTLGSKYEVEESSTARQTEGRRIDYGFVSTLDAEARRRGIREVGYGIRDTWVDLTETVPEIEPMTVGEVNTRVIRDLHSATQTRKMSKNLEEHGIEAIRLFSAYASFKDFMVYQMDVKSVFLYGKIKEGVYVCQPPGFEDPDFPNRVYKVEKSMYGLHQAPKA
nr:putative ribonuclease H-like domain-containing protein [Tanacetum cinerariifolium]